MIAEVIVDVAHSQVDKIFEYVCPPDLKVGSRVKVPFGGRQLTGFVIGLKQTSLYPAEKLKKITSICDEVPALVPECFSLMQSIANRYKVPKASSLRLFLPSEMRTDKVHEIYEKYVKRTGATITLSKSAKKQQDALDFMVDKDEFNFTLLCEKFGRGAINSLIEKGALTLEKRKKLRAPTTDYGEEESPKILTPAQEQAVRGIESATQTVNLIHGVTGSGKTEIYLSVIADIIKRGKTAIFLVPEISLTPQMLSQLRRRFKGEAAILHSGLSAGEKFDEWWRLRTGEAKIAIGARSAVFAPLENLGVIIIDEEHDSSYNSESAPRYSTIEVAKMRAEYNGCKLVLGSATPSVETYKMAKEGQYNLITLTERINKRAMPEIIIADMRREVRRGNNGPFSSALKDELAKTLQKGNQAIIFINRRGYSQTVICRDCGYVAKCEHCDVSLTYHSEEDCLKCHYCGTKYHMLSACPDCGGHHLRYSGTGTQRVVADLKTLFPDARIIRMDNDTVAGKDGHYKILKKFASREADILVGTQMIAKGHDFPAVTLVGILDADMSLHFSDYRSGERTFQLITQVAGRSGRADETGKVVLQTYCPENHVLRYATAYDYDGFFANEIDIRNATQYPPYSLVLRIMVTSESDEDALETLKGVYFETLELKENNADKFIFFNKMRSPVKKIQGKVRYQVLMRLTDKTLLEKIYAIAVKHTSQSVLVYVEENPANLS